MMSNFNSIVKYDKDGCAHMNCKAGDETFLYFMGMVFQACVNTWKISFSEFADMVVKYDLPSYIYDNYLILCHYGTPGVVEIIKKYIQQEMKK